MIEIKLQVSEVNYEQIAEKLLPLALDKLKNNSGDGKLGAFLKMAAMLPPQALSGLLTAMPQDTKDELVVMLLNLKKDSLIHAAEQFAERKGISVQIQDVAASIL